MYPKILPEVRGGAQRAEGSVVEGKLLYYCLHLYCPPKNVLPPVVGAMRPLGNVLPLVVGVRGRT